MTTAYEELVRQEMEHYSRSVRTSDQLTTGRPVPSWTYLERQTDNLIAKTTGQPDRMSYIASLVSGRPYVRVLSLGSGTSPWETHLARRLGANYEIVCTDINQDILVLGRERAREQGVNLVFQELDINKMELEEESYDLIVAFASLHHFVELEHVFTQVNRALKPDGYFATLDVVTQNRYLMWPETHGLLNRIWAILPSRFKFIHPGSGEPFYSPEPDNVPAELGFECIRSQDILPLLAQYLDPVLYIPLYSFCRRLLDQKYGPNFDMDAELDRTMVEFIWQLDCYCLKQKILPPETVFAALRKKGTAEPGLAQSLRDSMLQDARNGIQPQTELSADSVTGAIAKMVDAPTAPEQPAVRQPAIGVEATWQTGPATPRTPQRVQVSPVTTFGAGFFEDEGDSRWMDQAGNLFVWAEALSKPTIVSVEISCGDAEQYAQFPLEVCVRHGREIIAQVVFSHSQETQVIHLALSKADGDVRLCFESSSSFPACPGGIDDGQLRQQSVRVGGVRVQDASRLTWQCNICGNTCTSSLAELGREIASCPGCGSTVRMRAIVHLLSTELFGRSMPISAFPVRPDIRGIGLSDWIGYAAQLPHKLNYSNTYYHQEPRLDITVIDPALEGTLDFLISTDVFEHVAPPVSICFENSYRLLKPNGVLILSVPYDLGPATREHFPELHDYQIVHQDDKPILIDVTADGRRQVFEDLVFHGGEGETLEMRYFSETGLLAELKKAGFQCIKIHHEPALAYGIYWHDRQQLPITARKG